jgi:hypothetical protein
MQRKLIRNGCVFSAILIFQLLCLWSVNGEDPAIRFMREAQNRADYWRTRGYDFDPLVMGADAMDRRVDSERRAAYWRELGFEFDPSQMTADTMDQKAEAKLRVEYWRRWGIEFDDPTMDAETMDEAAVQLKERLELEKWKAEKGEQPAIIIDEKAAEKMRTPPQIRGAKRTRTTPPNATGPAAPLQFGGGAGGAGGIGGGQRGAVPAQGGGNPSPQANVPNSRRARGGSLQDLRNLEPEEADAILEELQRDQQGL